MAMQRAGLFWNNDEPGPATVSTWGVGHESWASESFDLCIDLDSTESSRWEMTQDSAEPSALVPVPRWPEGVVPDAASSGAAASEALPGLTRGVGRGVHAGAGPELCPAPHVAACRGPDLPSGQGGPGRHRPARGLESGESGRQARCRSRPVVVGLSASHNVVIRPLLRILLPVVSLTFTRLRLPRGRAWRAQWVQGLAPSSRHVPSGRGWSSLCTRVSLSGEGLGPLVPEAPSAVCGVGQVT